MVAKTLAKEKAAKKKNIKEDKEKDLINALRFHVMMLEKGNIDKDDFVNAVEELAFGQRRGPMQEEDVDEVMGVDRKGRKKSDYKSNLTNVDEDLVKEAVSKDDIKKALKGTKVEIEAYMDSLERSGDKFDSIEDYVEDFENYVADKSLQEHFKRFI